MWIAKPVRELSEAEQAQWTRILLSAPARGDEAPLSQSLAWARAIDSVSGRSYAVFSPDEGVGGIVFASADPSSGGVRFECVNGPLLDWGDASAAPRQLATFATAVSRLHSRFSSLSLRPRWRSTVAPSRLGRLPIEPHSSAQAATLQLPLRSPGLEDRFSLRLRRTLRASDQAGVQCRWRALDRGEIADFAPRMAYFARSKGFTAPPVHWFLALTQGVPAAESLRFGMIEAWGSGSGCQLLLALHGETAHYLFGHEWREPGVRAALSPSAVAHRFAIRKAAELGAQVYDFNGFLEDAPEEHPYAGVSRFKAQFGADLVRYEVPEFRIQ